MLEPFEHRGLWWLPEQSEERVAGVLTFSQEGTRLELIGLLPRQQPKPDERGVVELPLGGAVSRQRILGLSVDGKAFTLEDCQAVEFKLSAAGVPTEAFVPVLILRGAHYEAEEEVVFDEFAVAYTQLDAWVSTSGFDRVPAREGEERGIDISFREPHPITVELPDATVEIGFGWSLKDASPHGPEVSVRQRSSFLVRFKHAMSVEAALDYVYQLRNFVGLGVGQPLAPTRISGFVLPPDDIAADPLTDLKPGKLRIDLFYRLAHVPAQKERHPAQMLFTLPEAHGRLQELLANWFEKQELLRPVFDLYFAAAYNPHAYLEQRFLTLMQAIETYHRRTSSATDLPPDEHARRVDEILAATPEEYHDWLQAKLRYSNELWLQRRLDEVVGRCPTVTNELIPRRSFAHRVRVARNYLTHYDVALEAEAARGLDLYPLTVQLQALIEMCLLLELGFDCNEIDRFFKRARRYEAARRA
jgi:hypothetical protein